MPNQDNLPRHIQVVHHKGSPDTYRVQLRMKPGEKPRSKTLRTPEEAEIAYQAMLAERKGQRQQVEDRASTGLTLAEFFDAHGNDVLARIKPTTRNTYLTQWRKRIYPVFGSRRLSEITQQEVKDWSNKQLPADGASDSTRRQAFYMLNKLFTHAVQETHDLAMSPSAGQFSLTADEIPARARLRVLLPRTVVKIADRLPANLQAMVYMMAFAGLRFSEAADLTKHNVIERGGETFLKVDSALTRTGGTTTPKTMAGYREIPLSPMAVKKLREHMDQFPPAGESSWLFTTKDGSPVQYSNFRTRYWLPAVKGLDVGHVTLHDLRHTAVSVWISQGADVKHVAIWAGHSSAAFTIDVYGHLFDQGSGRVMKALDEWWTENGEPKDAA